MEKRKIRQFRDRCIFAISLFISLGGFSQTFHVHDFGVSGEKAQKATSGIQAAIDACHMAGGGKVYFPPGDYTSGTLYLKGGVNLHLEAGATLWASRDSADYSISEKIYKKNDSGDPDEGLTNVLIYAKNANNIALTGRGRIHGQAQRRYGPLEKVDSFIEKETALARDAGIEMQRWYKVPPHPTLIFLESCQDILIRNLQLIESPEWTLHFKWCDRAQVQGVYIQTSLEQGVNADGIDIDGSKNITVSDCIIETGDDAIVLKTTRTFGKARSCENITVTNCILTSTSTALKLGTESHADFRYITFSNCVIRNSNRGLSIVIRDGGTAEYVRFANILLECKRKPFFWWGDGDPIWLVVKKRKPDSQIGHIQHVYFENISASGPGTSRLQGFPGHPLSDVVMSNVNLKLMPEQTPDKRASNIILAEYCQNLTMTDVRLHWNDDAQSWPSHWQHALSLHQVTGALISGISVFNSNEKAPSPLFFNQVRDITITGFTPGNDAQPYLTIENSDCSLIRLEGKLWASQTVIDADSECGSVIETD